MLEAACEYQRRALPIGPRKKDHLHLQLRCALLAVLLCPAVFAGERMRYMDTEARGPFLSLALPQPAVPANSAGAFLERRFDYSLTYAESGRQMRSDLWSLAGPSRLELDLASDPSIVLARGKLASRHGYEAWTGFHAGYGQFFGNDKVGRSRTSGAGIEDPDWFFIRVSFTF